MELVGIGTALGTAITIEMFWLLFLIFTSGSIILTILGVWIKMEEKKIPKDVTKRYDKIRRIYVDETLEMLETI